MLETAAAAPRAEPDRRKHRVPHETRRVAVELSILMPVFNERETIREAIEDALGADIPVASRELVVVDDGSTDGTRREIDTWLPGHDGARRLGFAQNRGMSAAYYLAFTDLRARLHAGELDERDLVFTVDADGQHDLGALDVLERITVETGLDALLAQRDLSGYPRYKQLGNWVMSAWASVCAGSRLYDVESGYRIFRLGALADALDYYRGYKYSETVEVAVVLCRLGYSVRNDMLVPVPLYRSRTSYTDAAIDFAMIVVAAGRVFARRGKRRLPGN